jgi:hypothetical protein
MSYSDRTIGFSTGAIAKGDFRRALAVLKRAGVRGVELSALREDELPELSRSIPDLDLAGFVYASVHAPTTFVRLGELDVIGLLEPAAFRRLPIVVHPDAILTPRLWRAFGNLLLIENMDKRKPIGRTSAELKEIFDNLPEARLCFDVAHARQIDPTMVEAAQMLRDFNSRISEVHVSGVTARSTHGPISTAASFAYSGVAHLVPAAVPIILESPVDESLISNELHFAADAFNPWLERLRADIDDVFDLKVDTLRKSQVENFLRILQMTQIKLNDFENVVGHLPSGGALESHSAFMSSRDLLNRLSDEQKCQLRSYLIHLVSRLALEFPDLKSKFREQFLSVNE